MTTLGRIDDFDPIVESISTYLERVQLFIRGKLYGKLCNILSLEQPAGKSYDELKTVLKAHYELKPILIAERFNLHKRNQNPTESIAEFVAEL